MTPEQEKQVEEIREEIPQREKQGFTVLDLKSAKFLLAIVDDLRKQLNAYSLLSEAVGSVQPKQYTEQELRAEFEKRNPYLLKKKGGLTSHGYLSSLYWLECARFLGAVKE